jgi:uncharacterized protein HemX
MEVTSFVLGMLAIVAVLFAATTIVGMLRISKIAEQVQLLQTELHSSFNHLDQHSRSESERVWRQFENCSRDVTMVERTLMQHTDRGIDEAHRAMADISASDRRYIDSRIDKLIDVYFTQKELTKQTKKEKEVLKG